MLLLQWHENKMKNVALQHAKQGVDSSMYLGSNSVTMSYGSLLLVCCNSPWIQLPSVTSPRVFVSLPQPATAAAAWQMQNCQLAEGMFVLMRGLGRQFITVNQ
jgi:hypothetical protein